MRLLTFVLLVFATSCSSATPSESGLTEPEASTVIDTETTDNCRESATEPSIPAPETVDLVLAGIARARTNDLACGPPPADVRICRALFSIATLDPALSLHEPEQFARVNDAVQWAAGDGASVAPTGLAAALLTVEGSALDLATASDDGERLAALQRRLEPGLAETLDNHWLANCL